MEDSDKQILSNSQTSTNDRPWLWKKGQSGNPKGRPKGVTMKEYARRYLAAMTDEERETFMEGLPKELIWKMAEGNPETDVKADVSVNVVLANELAHKYNVVDTKPSDNSEGLTQVQSS